VYFNRRRSSLSPLHYQIAFLYDFIFIRRTRHGGCEGLHPGTEFDYARRYQPVSSPLFLSLRTSDTLSASFKKTAPHCLRLGEKILPFRLSCSGKATQDLRTTGRRYESDHLPSDRTHIASPYSTGTERTIIATNTFPRTIFGRYHTKPLFGSVTRHHVSCQCNCNAHA
jgi:hypothetical protein